MADDVIQPILDAMTASVGVPFRPFASAPVQIRRAALESLSSSETKIAPFETGNARFLALQYDSRHGNVIIAGPYTRSADSSADMAVLDPAAEGRLLRALGTLAPALLGIASDRLERIELATQLEVATSSVIAVTGQLALDVVLRRIVDLARQLAGARYAALGVPDDNQRLVAFITSGMTAQQESRIGPLPRGEGILGLLLREPKTIRMSDLSQHPASVGFPEHHPPMTTFLGVPIVAHGRVLGNLYLTDKITGAEFSVRDERLVEILALHAAVAIENARLYQTLEREQQRLEAVLERLPEAVMIIERHPDRVTLVNDQTSTLLGWQIETPVPLEEYLAMNPRSTPEGVPIALADVPIMRALLRGDISHQEEVGITRPDGSHITVLLNAAPIHDSSGTLTGAIAVFQDITLIKDAETLKDDFLSIVSHELRTPMTTIRGGATMLLRDSDKLDHETRAEILLDISNESNRLAILVENMVQLAHIRAGRLAMETEPVHILSAIRAAIAAEQQPLGTRHCAVSGGGKLVVAADPRSLEQVIRNLLHNAMKYSPSGTQIDVSAEHDESTDMVTIAVRDYGIGIDATEVPHVFERFRRSSTVESQRIPGMGLGLYLCRELVEAHGGRIWIESPTGGGTCVRFTLPIAAAEE